MNANFYNYHRNGHRIERCDATTGHVVRAVALCDTEDSAEEIYTAIQSHVALVNALSALRRNVDVSTIRPGKKNQEQWERLIAEADTALKLARA